MSSSLDLLLINPSGREQIYQELGDDLTAVEPPLWCRLIAGYVRDRGYRVEIIDAEADELDPEAVAEKVAARKPRWSAWSCSAISRPPRPSRWRQRPRPALPSKIAESGAAHHHRRRPSRRCRNARCAKMRSISFATAKARSRSRNCSTCCGGEPPDFAKVQGLVWWDSGQVRNNISPPLIKDLDKDLHGNVWDLLPMDKYRAHNWQCFADLESRKPYASIYTSLGCPYKCTFCCINAPFGTNRYRMRSPKAVAAEIDHLYNAYGVKTYKIIDEMFVLNERHVLALCDELIARNYDLNIWAYARVDTVRPHMLEKLRKAGIRWLALGIESGSEHVRDGAEKSFTQSEIIDIVRQIQKAGISVIGNFIFGLPDDDLAPCSRRSISPSS